MWICEWMAAVALQSYGLGRQRKQHTWAPKNTRDHILYEIGTKKCYNMCVKIHHRHENSLRIHSPSSNIAISCDNPTICQILLSCWLAAMGKPARLAPDPSVGVHDLCKAFNELCEKSGCRDLAKILYSKERVTWKTAADGSWLGSDSLCDLYTSLFAIHSNGALSSKKVKIELHQAAWCWLGRCYGWDDSHWGSTVQGAEKRQCQIQQMCEKMQPSEKKEYRYSSWPPVLGGELGERYQFWQFTSCCTSITTSQALTGRWARGNVTWFENLRQGASKENQWPCFTQLQGQGDWGGCCIYFELFKANFHHRLAGDPGCWCTAKLFF